MEGGWKGLFQHVDSDLALFAPGLWIFQQMKERMLRLHSCFALLLWIQWSTVTKHCVFVMSDQRAQRFMTMPGTHWQYHAVQMRVICFFKWNNPALTMAKSPLGLYNDNLGYVSAVLVLCWPTLIGLAFEISNNVVHRLEGCLVFNGEIYDFTCWGTNRKSKRISQGCETLTDPAIKKGKGMERLCFQSFQKKEGKKSVIIKYYY